MKIVDCATRLSQVFCLSVTISSLTEMVCDTIDTNSLQDVDVR
jgi:hypothetical protein